MKKMMGIALVCVLFAGVFSVYDKGPGPLAPKTAYDPDPGPLAPHQFAYDRGGDPLSSTNA